MLIFIVFIAHGPGCNHLKYDFMEKNLKIHDVFLFHFSIPYIATDLSKPPNVHNQNHLSSRWPKIGFLCFFQSKQKQFFVSTVKLIFGQ